MAEKYVLELTRKQAQMVKDACELYARLKIGQFNRITEMMLDVRGVEEYCLRRDAVNEILKAAANIIFGQNIKQDSEHHRAWTIYATIRHKMAWHDNPDGNPWSVSFDEPYSMDGEPVPKCTVVESEE